MKGRDLGKALAGPKTKAGARSPRATPPPPSWVSEDQKEIWEEVVELLGGKATALEVDTVSRIVLRIKRASAHVEADAPIVQDTRGNAQIHPSLEVLRRAESDLRAWIKSAS